MTATEQTVRPRRARDERPRFATQAAGVVPVMRTVPSSNPDRPTRLAQAAASFYRIHGVLPETLTDDVGVTRIAGACEHCGRIVFGPRRAAAVACRGCSDIANATADAEPLPAPQF